MQEGYVTKVTVGKANAGGGVPMTAGQATVVTVTHDNSDQQLKPPSSPSNTSMYIYELIFSFIVQKILLFNFVYCIIVCNKVTSYMIDKDSL